MSIKIDTLRVSIKAAKRFIHAAEFLEKQRIEKDLPTYKPGKNVATMKRASMDLTRMLAHVRQGR
jgi:hypothetical protein